MIRTILLSSFFATSLFMQGCFSLQSQILETMNLQMLQNRIKLTKLKTFNNFFGSTSSPNGKLLALFGRNYIDIVEITSDQRATRIVLDNAVILGAKFSPDGRLLALASRVNKNTNRAEFKLSLWDVSSGKENLTLPVVEDEWYRIIDDLSFSSDGSLLASNLGGTARLWNTADGTIARRFAPPPGKDKFLSERVLLSPDGRRMAVYFKTDEPSTGLIRVWNLSNEKQIELQTNIYLDWAFSTNSNLLVFTTIKNKGRSDEHSAAEVWNIDSGLKKIIEVPSQWRGAYAVAFSPDDSTVAIGGYKKFGIFSTQTGDLLGEEQHARYRFFKNNDLTYQINSLEFSPDGKFLLTGSNELTVKLWRISK